MTHRSVRPLFNGTSDFVQSAVGHTHSTATSCTLPNAPTVGNVLVFGVGIYPGANTTTAPTGVDTIDAGAGSQMRTYDRVVQAGDGQVYQFTASASSYLTVMCEEYAGVDVVNPIDNHGTHNFSNQTAISTLSVTPVTSGDLPVAFFGDSQSGSFSNLTTGWTDDLNQNAGAFYEFGVHGPIADTSAQQASITLGAAGYGGAALVLLKSAAATPTPSATPSPTPTPTLTPSPTPSPTATPGGTVIWQAGASGSLGAWALATSNQCGTPSVTGSSFYFDLVKSGTSCLRNMANPNPNGPAPATGNGVMLINQHQQYTWTFHFVDGNNGVTPFMGTDTDAGSLIFQVHPYVFSGSPCFGLNFWNDPNQGNAQAWNITNCAHGGGGNGTAPLWSGTYTPGESDDFKIVATLSTGSDGAIALYRNGVQQTLLGGGAGANMPSGTTQQFWNFGPYKWRWCCTGSNMTEVSATINNMVLTTP